MCFLNYKHLLQVDMQLLYMEVTDPKLLLGNTIYNRNEFIRHELWKVH